MKTNELIAILRDEDNPNVLDYIQEAVDALEGLHKRIEELEAEQGKPLTAFLSPIDAYQGLKRKYLVFKADTGEMVENCFVLRPDRDPAAVEALRVYASATDNSTLSADIVNWVGEGEGRRWIPVTERLPEKEGDYLIYATGPFNGRKFMAVMHYEKDVYLPIWSDTTHWMPLPEPPKEGKA